MIRNILIVIMSFIVLSSCYRYPVVSIDKLYVCRNFSNKFILAKVKNISSKASYSTWLPFSYGKLDSTEEYIYYKRYMELYEVIFYNDNVLITTNGSKFNIQNLEKLESKRNMDSKKIMEYINENKIDTSNLIKLNCD